MKFEDLRFINKTDVLIKDSKYPENIFNIIHLLDKNGLDKLEEHFLSFDQLEDYVL